MTTPNEHSHEPSVDFDVDNVVKLAKLLESKIRFTDEGLPKRPWGKSPSLAAFKKAFESGLHELPHEYIDTYAKPLEAALPRLAAHAQKDHVTGRRNAEALLGAIYCHVQQETVTKPVRRLMAVTSFLYRSFMDEGKLAHLNLQMRETLPPLATLQQYGGMGPYTLTVGSVRRLIGPQASVGVVSLPSVMREHPVLWGILGHEIGGHDVQNAAPGLMNELSYGIRNMFEQLAMMCARAGNQYSADLNMFFGKLWSWWLSEAAADVYGILNIGPVFVFSLNAKLQARMGKAQTGHDMYNDPNSILGSHPMPLLRIHLGIGVVQSLRGLEVSRRDQYVKHLENLAELNAGDAKTVKMRGKLIDTRTGRAESVDREIPLEAMQLSAISAGRYLASVPLRALQGHNIQVIQSWDDADELMTGDLIQAMRDHKQSLPIGDPSHVISAGAAEMLNNPDLYDETNAYIGAGLDRCFQQDPIWGDHTHERHAAERYLHEGEEKE